MPVWLFFFVYTMRRPGSENSGTALQYYGGGGEKGRGGTLVVFRLLCPLVGKILACDASELYMY